MSAMIASGVVGIGDHLIINSADKGGMAVDADG